MIKEAIAKLIKKEKPDDRDDGAGYGRNHDRRGN